MGSEIGRRRLVAAFAIAIAVGAMAFLAFGGLGENLVYYWSPTELSQAGDEAYGATVRLGGLVAPGTIHHHGDGLTLDFHVTDGSTSIPVTARTVPPAMFREGIGVVVEGSLSKDGVFQTTRLMVKHDNEYRAPSEGDEPDVEKLMESMQFEGNEG